MSSTKKVAKRVERIQQEVAKEPSVGLQYLNKLNNWMVHEDPKVRYGGLDIMLKMSADYPYQLRDHVSTVISRLDDESVSVRGAALTLTYNLARWYPQEFGHTTEYLLKVVKDSQEIKESAIAVGILSRLASLLPVVVTPRVEIREVLISFTDRDNAKELLDSCNIGIDLVETAIDVLAGGDMASRPLEADLAPIPHNTKLSKPAQIGFRGIVWGAMIPLFSFVMLINAFRFAWRFRYLSPMGRAKVMISELRKLKFISNTYRRTLYLRSSMYPTSTQIFRFLPGRAPVSEKLNGENRPLPEDWGIRANLVRHRDGFYCRNCGVGGGPNGDAELHVDHQIPRSAGGGDNPENLRTLCRQCHEARHARVFDT